MINRMRKISRKFFSFQSLYDRIKVQFSKSDFKKQMLIILKSYNFVECIKSKTLILFFEFLSFVEIRAIKVVLMI
jgi:hypothetical protein